MKLTQSIITLELSFLKVFGLIVFGIVRRV